MPLQPDAYAQSCKQACLLEPPHPSGLPIGRQETIKTKWLPLAVKNRLPWSHNDILYLVRGSAPILWRTAFQAEYHVLDYPGTPPPSVYQVTHGTAIQAAERYVQQLFCGDRLHAGLR